MVRRTSEATVQLADRFPDSRARTGLWIGLLLLGHFRLLVAAGALPGLGGIL